MWAIPMLMFAHVFYLGPRHVRTGTGPEIWRLMLVEVLNEGPGILNPKVCCEVA